ncbi:MAG: hypothetical protein JWO38_2419 [Gemmataceae bacterium]|nr:hypothetical protein [Gemmataceae bacterium]
MVDIATHKPLQVEPSAGGPLLWVSVPQLDVLRPLLDQHRVTYWLSEGAASYGGGPYIAVVSFGRSGNAAQIQAVLDAAA